MKPTKPREYYEVLGHKIGSYPCVSIKSTTVDPTFDHCLSGERGEIWLHSPTICKAFVAYRKSEKIHSFNIRDLQRWITRLKVPLNPNEQLQYANNPNRRLDG